MSQKAKDAPAVPWSQDNPHPLSRLKTELVWDGKYDEYGRRREVDIAGCAMPLQRIETIDQPRSEAVLLTRDEVRAVALAAKETGAKEVHCLAWEFEMDLRLVCHALEAETGVVIKLIPIPREIMEKNRTRPPPFLEMAVLEAEAIVTSTKAGKTVDVKLKKFMPSLAEVPGKELEALKERAVKSGFDFIDFGAVDFDWHEGKPLEHHWQDYRTRKDRSLKTVSDAAYEYKKPGKHTICVKVVDVFGCDTSITLEVKV